jgi:hypothetical protein
MLKMKAKIQAPRLDISKYNTVLEKAARELLAQAVFEYVVTAQAVIPVWTGASITTFTDLAGLVGLPLVVNPTRSAAARPNLVNKMQAKARARSKGELHIGGGQYSFSYQTSLPHLVYNEYHNANIERPPELFSELKNPGPYNFQQHTKAAVSVVLKQFVLPDPRDHISVKRFSVR